jgi:hypothetical protein
MKKLTFKTRTALSKYEIVIGKGALDRVGETLKAISPSSVAIITSANVFGIHGNSLLGSLTG